MSNLKTKVLAVLVIVAAFAVVGVYSASAADCTVSATLRQGSAGAEVSCLQSKLGLTADGKFGPMTKAAVMSFQASKGLTADGVVGPMTRAAVNGTVATTGCPAGAAYNPMTGEKCGTTSTTLPAGCTSTSGYSVTTGKKCDGTEGGSTSNGPLEGGAGAITLTAKSTYSNEEVVAGDEEVPVLAFEVKADDNSDVEVTSVKVEFYNSNTASSRRIQDYADKVSILMGGDKVGEADASDFSESSKYYSKSISLENAVVKAGEKAQFAVAVTALANLDSGDIDTDSWNVDINNVRFLDADGVSTTETADAAGANDAGTFDRDLDFVDLTTSGDLEVKLATASASPEAGNVAVDTVTTTDVPVLEFTMKATGSDITIDAMEMTVTSSGVDNVWADMVSNMSLEADGDEIDSTSAFTDESGDDDEGGDILFSDLNLTINEGDTVTFKVIAQMRKMATPAGASATAFDRGDSLTVSFTTADLEDADTDITDANGDTVGATDLTGSAVGQAQTFYDIGVAVDMGTVTYDAISDGANTEQVTYNIPLTLTAFGADRYLGLSADLETDQTTISDGMAFSYAFQNSSAASTDIEAGGTLASTSTFTCDADIEATTAYRLDEGEKVNCTLQVIMTAPPTNSNSYRVHVEGVQTNDVAALTDGATHEIIQLLSPAQDFETAYKFITQ